MKDTIKAHATKVAAAYAAYNTTMKTVNKLADQHCHTWTLDRDYSSEMWAAGTALALEHMAAGSRLLPTRRSVYEHRVKTGKPEFQHEAWTLLRVPGIRFVQARRWGGDLHFRTLLTSDFDALRELVKQRCEADADDFDFDTTDEDGDPIETNIMGWNAKSNRWNHRMIRRARTFGSVFLPRELQAEIVADMKRYTDSRERLLRLEMPWRRGYLLTGPPGTGKTSLSTAIAGSLGFSLATLSLTEIESDAMLREAISTLPGRTVLVLEDLDAHAVSRGRDHNPGQDGKLSLSGLLNSLDGFETPEGLVVIATTNHVEHLDPALIRPGRFDRSFELGHIAAAELERLFTWFYEQGPATEAPACTQDAGIAPAEVAEIFKQHLDDPAAGWQAIREEIAHRTLDEALLAVLPEAV